MDKYKPKTIEPKWEKYWEKKGIYKDYSKSKNFYILDMFPYPSGAGLHVGHPKGYIATDVYARFMQLHGYSVLHPMGWDAFGLPAENYAIEKKIHPKISVKKNIATFKKQLGKFGFTYDWDREINTTDPEYYKWTQWIFLKMFEKGLAYESDEPINWCPKCKTGLALEDLEGGLCERCGTQVVQKKMRQWVLKMTAYADRLLADLENENLDWEESITGQQRNWIGRSEGTTIKFQIVVSSEIPPRDEAERSNSGLDSSTPRSLSRQERGSARNGNDFIEVFTTRVDTIFGCTYCVVAPEHLIVAQLESHIANREEVEKYIIKAQNKTELERTTGKAPTITEGDTGVPTESVGKKTGVEIKGIKVINPFNNEEIPLFVADYVLGHYGTGAVMAVPAHDERDFEFAKKYDLPIKKSIDSNKTYIVTIKRSLEIEFYDEMKKLYDVVETGGLVKIYSEEVDKILDLAKRNFIGSPWYIHSEGLVKKILFHTKEEDKVFDWSKENKTAYEFGLSIGIKKEQLDWNGAYEATVEDGFLINSDKYSGLTSEKAREEMTKWLEKNNLGRKKVNYKMRDWVFSRQRYWGEPIPIVHCEKCGAVGVPEKELPLKLPEVKSYQPTGTGEGPLAGIKNWINTKCPKCKGPAKRESNTMPQWAGSSWYYLRYIDPKNKKSLIDKKKEKEWMPVDLYVGGAEHATRHLLYARFWHKFLFDIGVVSTKEPFKKLIHVGLINGEDGRKMSKRWGNVINPDDVIKEFGADALRMYEMFMGPFTQNIAWSTQGVVGVKRFLERIWKLKEKVVSNHIRVPNRKLEILLHKTIKKVTEDIENFRFNTAISAMMILANEMEKEDVLPSANYKLLVVLLSPFAPHLAEELWQKLGAKKSIFTEAWPQYNADLIKEERIKMVVQINGKLRNMLEVDPEISEEEAKKLVLENEKIKSFLAGKEIKKVIFVKGRLVNIVA